MFGERPLCTVLRPRFLVARGVRAHPRDGLRARPRLQPRARGGDGAARRAGAVPARPTGSARCSADDDGQPWPSPLGRYDAFFTADGEGLRFTENNAETPAGSAYGDVLSDALPGPAGDARRSSRQYEVRPLPSRPPLLHTLLDALPRGHRAARAAGHRHHRLARGAHPERVPRAWRCGSASMGFTVVIADPRELEYYRGQAAAAGPHGDRPDLQARPHRTSWWAARGSSTPLVRAVRERAVVHGEPLPLQAAPQEGEPRRAERRAQRRPASTPAMRAADRRATCRGRGWWRTGRHRDRRRARWTCCRSLAATATASCSSPTTTTAAPGSCWAGKSTDADWEAALGRALDGAVHRAGAHPPARASRSRRWIDGRLDVSDRIVDTAPYVFGGG